MKRISSLPFIRRTAASSLHIPYISSRPHVCKKRVSSTSPLISSFSTSSDKNSSSALLSYPYTSTVYVREPSNVHLSPFSRYLSPDRHVGIVGAPFAGGQPLIGVDLGPNFIRKGDVANKLKADTWVVRDTGDIEIPYIDEESTPSSPIVKRSHFVGAVCQSLYTATLPILASNHFLLTLGGDHSIAMGSISGVLQHRPDVGIVWIDAHADINTPTSSISHNPHGMVVSFLLNLQSCRENTRGFEWMNSSQIPLLHPSRIVYIGLRDLDPAERAIIRSLNIAAFTMYDVDKLGIADVMRRAVDHLTHYGARPIHLSLDIDSIDPVFAPSTGTRVMGGLSYREGYYACEALAETGLLCSMDMVEVNPSLTTEEGSERTVQMAVGLIASAMGNKIL